MQWNPFNTDSYGPELSGCVRKERFAWYFDMKTTFREVLVYLTCNFSLVCIALFAVNQLVDPITQQQ